MVYSNELIGSGGNVEVWLLFIYKKCVRYPDVFDEFWTHGKGFHPLLLVEGQPWVRPELPKVEVQGKILKNNRLINIIFQKIWFSCFWFMNRIYGFVPTERIATWWDICARVRRFGELLNFCLLYVNSDTITAYWVSFIIDQKLFVYLVSPYTP